MAQLRQPPSPIKRPSLGQRLNSFRIARDENKQESSRHGSSKSKGASDAPPRTRSVDRPQRRNSFVRVDKAGLIITSTSTKTTSRRCSNSEIETPLKPSSLSSLKLPKRSWSSTSSSRSILRSNTTSASSTSTKGKKSKSGDATVSSSITITKKHRRKNYDDDASPRKPLSMQNLNRSKNKKKSKSTSISSTSTSTSTSSTTKTMTTKTCTIHPHLLYKKPSSFSSLPRQGSPKRSKLMKSSKSLRRLSDFGRHKAKEDSREEPRSLLRRSLGSSKSLRALSDSIRNLFGEDEPDTKNEKFAETPRNKSHQRIAKSKRSTTRKNSAKMEKQKQEAPIRRPIIIRVQ